MAPESHSEKQQCAIPLDWCLHGASFSCAVWKEVSDPSGQFALKLSASLPDGSRPTHLMAIVQWRNQRLAAKKGHTRTRLAVKKGHIQARHRVVTADQYPGMLAVAVR